MTRRTGNKSGAGAQAPVAPTSTTATAGAGAESAALDTASAGAQASDTAAKAPGPEASASVPGGAEAGASGGDDTLAGAQSSGNEGSEPAFLLGSDLLPGLLDVGGVEVQLGDVVRAAKTASGYSSAEWNDLQPETREKHIAEALEAMREKAEAEKAQAKPPAAPPAPVERVAAKPDYPRHVTFRHNGGLSVTEPATHAVITPGSTNAVVHSAEQAAMVRENLKAIAQANYWGEGILTVEGLPE